jgi:hypothetical protein
MIEETKLKGYCEYDNEIKDWKIGFTNLNDIMCQFNGNEVTIIIKNNNMW